MKTHYSISELLEMNLEKFPKTNRAILYKVEREKWSFIEASCQGGKNGKRREYAPPPDVMKQIQARKLEEALGGLEDLPSPTKMEGKPAVRNEETPLALPETVCIVDGSTEQQRLCESSRRGVLAAVERVMAEAGVSKEAAITTVLTQANALLTVAGIGGNGDFDLLKGIIDGLNIGLGAIRDGAAGLGIAFEAAVGVIELALSSVAKGLAAITFGDLSANFEQAAEEMLASADKHFGKAQEKALAFESKTAEAVAHAAETEAQRFARLEAEARTAYQAAAQRCQPNGHKKGRRSRTSARQPRPGGDARIRRRRHCAFPNKTRAGCTAKRLQRFARATRTGSRKNRA